MEKTDKPRESVTLDPRKLPKFDADLSTDHPTNREAARIRGLHWSERRKAYVDSDGCLRRDRFGQPL